MNEQKVNELLQRYFDGATTRDEERALQRYFAESDSDIPDSLKAYRPLFTFFAEERAVQPPARKERNIHIGWTILMGIAASIAILFMFGLPKTTESDNFVYFVNGQRVHDESAAIAMAENSLQLLAASMQKAHTGMAAFERLQESAQALQQFDKISEAYRHVMEIGSRFDDLRILN